LQRWPETIAQSEAGAPQAIHHLHKLGTTTIDAPATLQADDSKVALPVEHLGALSGLPNSRLAGDQDGAPVAPTSSCQR
jgi:hypothetical protein